MPDKPEIRTLVRIVGEVRSSIDATGILAAFVVDRERGCVDGRTREELTLDLELDALSSGDVLRLAQSVVAELDPDERIESLVFSFATQDHVISPSRRSDRRFLYVALDKTSGNLGLLLHRLATANS